MALSPLPQGVLLSCSHGGSDSSGVGSTIASGLILTWSLPLGPNVSFSGNTSLGALGYTTSHHQELTHVVVSQCLHSVPIS